MLKQSHRLLMSRRALAGIEFALVMPVMVLMLAGIVDISMLEITIQRLNAAAREVAVIASTLAAQPNGTNTLTGAQAYAAVTAPFANFPSWRGSGSPPFFVTLTEIEFTGTPAGCTATCTGYTPKVKWSTYNYVGIAFLRACGTPTIKPNGSAWDQSSIPAGSVGATSVLLSDVSVYFTPLLTGSFIGPLPLVRSAYVPPRVGNTVALTNTGYFTEICP